MHAQPGVPHSPSTNAVGLAPEEVLQSVEASFERVAPVAEALTTSFYEELFARRPDLRPLFPAELVAQRKKLAGAIGLAVGTLRKPAALVPVLRDLGRRHASYGVVSSHFEPVGGSLLVALAIHDPEWSADVRRAWVEVWTVLAYEMGLGLDEGLAAAR